MTISNRKPSSLVLQWHRTSVAIAFLVFSYASLSIHGTQHTQTFKQPSSAIIAFTDGYSGASFMLCNGHYIPVCQPNRRCELSLQCKCDNVAVCHKVLLLLFQLLYLSYLSLNSTSQQLHQTLKKSAHECKSVSHLQQPKTLYLC